MRLGWYRQLLLLLPVMLAAIVFSGELPSPTGQRQQLTPKHQVFAPDGWMENTEFGYRYRFSGESMELDDIGKTINIATAWLEIYRDNGEKWLAQADSALLNEAEQTILLQGNVAISHGTNHCLRTENVLLQRNHATINSRLHESYAPSGVADISGTADYFACNSTGATAETR